MPLPFQGTAWALSSNGLAAVASSLAVFAPEIWTVLAVETSGCGYLPDRRPQILYERHVFHRLTGGRYDDGDISDSSRGGYGARGAHQYDRLNLPSPTIVRLLCGVPLGALGKSWAKTTRQPVSPA